MMLIHSYFTNGMFDGAKLFLRSFKYFNGEEYKILLDTKDLSNDQVNELYTLYNNLEVYNDKLDIKKLAKRAGIKPNVLYEYKKETEHKKVNKKNKVGKLMIAADDRVKTVNNRMREVGEGNHLLHFDIDTFFDGPINEIVEMAKSNDFITGYRTQKLKRKFGEVPKKRYNRATLIYVMGFTNNKNSRKFMDRGIKYINATPPLERHKGFGQTTCYLAYLDCKDWLITEDVIKAKVGKNSNKGGKTGSMKRFTDMLNEWESE